MDHSNVALAVFSQPPVAAVGMSENEARSDGRRLDIYKTSFKALKHTLSGSTERTFMKLVVDRDSQVVLGVHMVGADAPEIIQSLAVAVKMGATKSQFDRPWPCTRRRRRSSSPCGRRNRNPSNRASKQCKHDGNHMNLNHTGKRVLITGGSKGIGFACATAFIAEGAKVAICSRSRENLDQALKSLSGAIGVAADCSDAAAAQAMVGARGSRARPDRHSRQFGRGGEAGPGQGSHSGALAGGDGCEVFLRHQCHRSADQAHGRTQARRHRQHHRHGRQGRLVGPPSRAEPPMPP